MLREDDGPQTPRKIERATRLGQRSEALERRWAAWCAQARRLEQSAGQLWADYESILQDMGDLQRQARFTVFLCGARLGKLPPELEPVRQGKGFMRWRPKD